MERIQVFHQKLSAAQEPGFCAKFHSEFILNLIERLGKVFIGRNEFLCKRNDDFFVRGTERKFAAARVFQLIEVIHRLPSAGLHPIFFRMERRQKKLLGAECLNFLADDVFYFLEYPQSERQIGINAGGKLVYESGAGKKFRVSGNLIFRRILPRMRKKSRHFHPVRMRNRIHPVYHTLKNGKDARFLLRPDGASMLVLEESFDKGFLLLLVLLKLTELCRHLGKLLHPDKEKGP